MSAFRRVFPLAASLVLLAACDNGIHAGDATTGPGATSVTPPAPVTTTAPAIGPGVFGPGCDSLRGRLAAMADLPVVRAAAVSFVLGEWVEAVEAAHVADPLDGARALTVFAPVDAAFDAAGPSARRVSVLDYHVLGQRLDAAGLQRAGGVRTRDGGGGPLAFDGSETSLTVNGVPVLCGNIPTKNATLFVIGKVLTPGTIAG
ncbi:fasciclin domain-containing protein [Amycolatopsis sp.]|uniref:fasciclin domain-containing protein n=1 Tax=Amycolatopsis sp. TaxID=37632 RepID=UPI002D7E97AE|nr:fasciclin domain-containing protein [Amycolatopsis sp.]HET6707719.1 fasciclin domain-containing protein [Amycolatopsis sp.]